METVGIGFIGAGQIATYLCEHLIQEDVKDCVRLAAICDPVLERAKDVAKTYDIAKYYLTHKELLADSDVHIVSICSPIGKHYEHGMKAIEAGKYGVHFNKTMTTTVVEADELIAFATKKGTKIVASPGMMLFPHNQRIRRLVLEGVLGRLTWAIAGTSGAGEYHLQEKNRKANPSWYFQKQGGGPQYDLTVYCLHSLTGILGRVQRVTAMSGKVIPEREFQGQRIICEADDTTLMTLDFDGSLFAYVYATVDGSITTGFEPTIHGTKGSIIGTIFGKRDLAQPSDFQAHVTAVHAEMSESHVFADVMQLVDWVRDGKPSIVSAEHARHVIEIIEAGYTAVQTGQTQTLRTSFVPMSYVESLLV